MLMPADNPVPFRSRQSPVALLFIIGTFFVRVLRQAWPLLLIAYFRGSGDRQSVFLLWVILGITITTLVLSLLNYFRFFFWIEGGALVIEQGVLKKSRVSVPFEKIQTINSEQNLLYRYFDVVKLEIDTAGKKGSEVKIDAVPAGLARELRTYVHGVRREQPLPDNEIQDDREEAENLLMKLSAADLLKIGLSQDHLRAVAVFLIFSLGRFEDAREMFGNEADRYLEQASGEWLQDIFVLTVLLVVVLLVSLLLSLAGTFVRYYSFRMMESRTGFRTISGLLTRRERHMKFVKMQMAEYVTGPVRQFFGLYSVKIHQAAPEEKRKNDAVVIPGCYRPELDRILHQYFQPEEEKEKVSYGVSALMIPFVILLSAILPALFVAAIIWLSDAWEYWLVPVFLIVFMSLRAFVYHRRFRFAFSGEWLEVQSGYISLRTRLIPLHKVQATEIRQNFMQRRRGIASLVLYTAAGRLEIPFIPAARASQLQDYILFKIWRSGGSWM